MTSTANWSGNSWPSCTRGGLARRRSGGIHAAYRLTKAGACIAQACQNMLGDLGAATAGVGVQAQITREMSFPAAPMPSG